MAICRECGAQIADGNVFCGNCGAVQNSSCEAPFVSGQPQPAYEAPAYGRPYPPEDAPQPTAAASEQRPSRGSRYAVVGSWGFFFSLLLLNIPVIGWIFTIVWACGGIRNLNLQRLARACIISWIVSLAVSVAVYLLGGLSLSTIAGFFQNL